MVTDEWTRVYERLARVGLVVPPGEPRVRPPAEDCRRAREAAGRGTPLSDLVTEDRE